MSTQRLIKGAHRTRCSLKRPQEAIGVGVVTLG